MTVDDLSATQLLAVAHGMGIHEAERMTTAELRRAVERWPAAVERSSSRSSASSSTAATESGSSSA